MTEFDFEELDKAVSDLMKDNGTPNDDLKPSATAQTASPSPVAEPSEQVAPQKSPDSLAVKRRGKFMDVMHPPKGTMSSRPLANHGATSVSSEPKADTQQQSEPVEQPATQQNDEVSEGDSAYASNPVPANEWPDPIDFTGVDTTQVGEESTNESPDSNDQSHEPVEVQNDQPAVSETPEADNVETEESKVAEEPKGEPKLEVAPADALDTVIEPEFLPETNEPDIPEEVVAEATAEPEVAMESPFLPDAKVEKRPLGVFTTDDTQADTSADVNQPNNDEPKAEQANPELPRELSSELMGLESSSSPISPVLDEGEPKNENTAPVESSEPEKQPEIKQQYTEKPSSAEASSGAIYDTNNYHQPIAAQAGSKKHKWILYVIWVLVLLIIGACAGAIYFYLSTR